LFVEVKGSIYEGQIFKMFVVRKAKAALTLIPYPFSLRAKGKTPFGGFPRSPPSEKRYDVANEIELRCCI
jgi:hypothetical protein